MINRTIVETKLHRLWYGTSYWWIALWPLSCLYGAVISVRRWLFKKGWISTQTIAVPVVVIGNITVGGVGKTPLVLCLAQQLLDRGIKPGIVSRGYGSRVANKKPLRVLPESHSDEVGDEAMLMIHRIQVPIFVCTDRAAAAKKCAESVDVVLSDDGLQHYRLQRDVEIVVIDAQRQLGNRHLLPAGPLREPSSRLNSVDQVIMHHTQCDGRTGCMSLVGDEVINVNDDRRKKLHQITNQTVHAVAGIGNPSRFFNTLRRAGFKVIEHHFADHHRYQPSDFLFTQECPIVMTEKDAVKCRALKLSDCWYLKVNAYLSDDVTTYFHRRIDQLMAQPHSPAQGK